MSRIEQFRKMATDDPGNALGHFSLGRELLAAGQYAEALQSLRRVVEIDPNISRAYQHTAQALLRLDRRDEAIEQLAAGVKVAVHRGDLQPKNEMVRMLTELGAPVPEEAAGDARPAAQVGEGQVQCRRCGRVAQKLAKPPMRSAFGQEIYENICADCWREAIGFGTKVINELRLPLNDPQASKLWDQHVKEFLNLT
ncbi:MAG TPA: Fe(2+)-trafficking protein [Tepidisphaeraceae bacterium]|nr:Fe(2+)-trafficking protein [Tepidisphaeraceae bacterium]